MVFPFLHSIVIDDLYPIQGLFKYFGFYSAFHTDIFVLKSAGDNVLIKIEIINYVWIYKLLMQNYIENSQVKNRADCFCW